MMLVFSDGFATTTSVPGDAAKVCAELAVAVYPVLLGHWKLGEQRREASPKNPSAIPSAAADRLNEKQREVEDFASLARLTGGHAFDPPVVSLDVLRRVLAGLVAEARTEYVLGFTPEPAELSRHRKFEVRLKEKPGAQMVLSAAPFLR